MQLISSLEELYSLHSVIFYYLFRKELYLMELYSSTPFSLVLFVHSSIFTKKPFFGTRIPTFFS
jgi:hypothetical protein